MDLQVALRLGGLAFGVLFLGAGMLNATMMLVSPRKWFDLPEWLSAKGSLTRKHYSTGALLPAFTT